MQYYSDYQIFFNITKHFKLYKECRYINKNKFFTFIIGKPDVQITLGTPNRRGPYKLYNPRQLFLKNHQKTLVITPPKKKTL